MNLAHGRRLPRVWTDDFVETLSELGELTLREHGSELADAEAAAFVRAADVAIVGWDARPLPAELADDPGSLRFVCCYSGTIRHCVPGVLVASGLKVANWGDHPAKGVAEAAMTLLLAVVKELPAAISVARRGEWGLASQRRGTLVDTAVGIYGCGAIGRRFVELLRPFGARIHVFDPYTEELPGGCARAASLASLCRASEVLVIHAGLTDETRGSLRAEHFAALPDGGIVINTARGAILDQEALFAELVSGRLRAGLDVLEPDFLPADHPLRALENTLLTFHQLDQLSWPERPGLDPMQRRCVENLARFAAGDEPEWLFDLDRYERST